MSDHEGVQAELHTEYLGSSTRFLKKLKLSSPPVARWVGCSSSQTIFIARAKATSRQLLQTKAETTA